MSTIVDWKIIMGIVIGVWVFLVCLKWVVLKHLWAKELLTLDLVVPLLWWGLTAVTFQVWRQTILIPLLLMFLLWGFGIALWQGFVQSHFNFKTFLILWWRLVGIVSLLALIAMIVLVYLVSS